MILAIGFVVWEMRVPDPILDISLFKSRVFSMAIGARFLSFLGGSAVFFLTPFYLIQGLGYEADRAALLMIPGPVCMAVFGADQRQAVGLDWHSLARGGWHGIVGVGHVRPIPAGYGLARVACHSSG